MKSLSSNRGVLMVSRKGKFCLWVSIRYGFCAMRLATVSTEGLCLDQFFLFIAHARTLRLRSPSSRSALATSAVGIEYGRSCLLAKTSTGASHNSSASNWCKFGWQMSVQTLPFHIPMQIVHYCVVFILLLLFSSIMLQVCTVCSMY